MKIALVEDHHQALGVWRRLKTKGLSLVHIDSHIDFGFYQAKPPRQILEEARDLDDLKSQLEKTILYQRYRDDLEAQLNIANYIYPAMRDGIVSVFYWIIPGKRREFRPCLNSLKCLINRIKRRDPYRHRDIEIAGNRLSSTLYNRQIRITDIFSIQKIEKPFLLDIDVDFLLFDSVKESSMLQNIGRRKPWIYPDNLVGLIKKKFIRPVYTTIAYSVKGGFTPLEYRFFGDEIYLRLGKNTVRSVLENVFSLRNQAIEEYFKKKAESSRIRFEEALSILEDYRNIESSLKKRFLGHLYFWLFKINWKLQRKDEAIRCYWEAAWKDSAYRTMNNNFGWLYLGRNNFKSAADEFQKIVYCDPKNTYALRGLKEILIRQKRRKNASIWKSQSYDYQERRFR